MIDDLDGHGPPPDSFGSKIQQIFAYWDDKRGTRAVPDRRDVDPLIDLPGLISGVWLLDVVGPEPRFRYRLVGDDIRQAGKKNLVGQFVDDQPEAGQISKAVRGLQVAVAEKTPYWRQGKPHLRHSRYVSGLQFIGLPMTYGGDQVAMMMNLTVFNWQN